MHVKKIFVKIIIFANLTCDTDKKYEYKVYFTSKR